MLSITSYNSPLDQVLQPLPRSSGKKKKEIRNRQSRIESEAKNTTMARKTSSGAGGAKPKRARQRSGGGGGERVESGAGGKGSASGKKLQSYEDTIPDEGVEKCEFLV